MCILLACPLAPVEASVEYKVVVQALRLNTLSKLTFADGKRFDNLLKDVFKGVSFQDVKYEQLEGALREACKDCNLILIESQVYWEGGHIPGGISIWGGGGGGGELSYWRASKASETTIRGNKWKSEIYIYIYIYGTCKTL